MSMDGCFIHYLTNELNEALQNSKINHIYQPSALDIILEIRARGKNLKLLVSSKLNAPRVHLTGESFQTPNNPSNFCMILRKYIERGVIKNVYQHLNDRIIIFDIKCFNELEDEVSYYLIVELMGRNSNIILTKNDYTIIDAIRKLPPSNDSDRTILPHAVYSYAPTNKENNPFVDAASLDNCMGISNKLLKILEELDSRERITFLNQKIAPVIYENNNKQDFYAYSLSYNDHIIKEFNSLSELLDYYYLDEGKVNNSATLAMSKVVSKELKKLHQKADVLLTELSDAQETISKEDYGILLQANLYKVKKGDTKVVVNNFLKDNEEVEISIDPLLDPSRNLKKYFSKIKKAKTSLIKLNEQLNIVNESINYLDDILFQISIATKNDLDEIKNELTINGYLKGKVNNKNKKNNINLLNYSFENIKIYVGKNNVQNDYLTNKLAASNDYWFHVKDIPGSHVIVRIPENDANFSLSEGLIRYAANLAAYYSKAKTSSSVPVDYTKARYIKKIPGIKGYHVTYTNQHTIYIDPAEPER